jgi:type IV secretory pathway VirB3-like protein
MTNHKWTSTDWGAFAVLSTTIASIWVNNPVAVAICVCSCYIGCCITSLKNKEVTSGETAQAAA